MHEFSKKGTFFYLEYVGKDGVLRKRVCRFGVKSKLKGGKSAYDPDEKGCIVVYDDTAGGFRSVKWESIKRIHIEGKVFEIATN